MGVYCKECDMWLNSPEQWGDHRICKKHRKNAWKKNRLCDLGVLEGPGCCGCNGVEIPDQLFDQRRDPDDESLLYRCHYCTHWTCLREGCGDFRPPLARHRYFPTGSGEHETYLYMCKHCRPPSDFSNSGGSLAASSTSMRVTREEAPSEVEAVTSSGHATSSGAAFPQPTCAVGACNEVVVGECMYCGNEFCSTHLEPGDHPCEPLDSSSDTNYDRIIHCSSCRAEQTLDSFVIGNWEVCYHCLRYLCGSCQLQGLSMIHAGDCAPMSCVNCGASQPLVMEEDRWWICGRCNVRDV